jgi:hypothetical protein
MEVEPRIDKGVPLPPARRGNGARKGGGRRWARTLARMEVGDSFFLAGFTADQARNAMYYSTEKYSATIAVRPVVERGVAGVRVWRTK